VVALANLIGDAVDIYKCTMEMLVINIVNHLYHLGVIVLAQVFLFGVDSISITGSANG
jgi:hypothetical protein